MFFSYSSLKNINFPKVVSLGGSAFAFSKRLIRAAFPLAVFASGNAKFRECYLLVTGDYGPGVSKLNPEEFIGTYNLSELVLRKTDGIVELGNISALGTEHMTMIQQKIGHVYVPNSLKSTYQSATNWSTLYGSNNDIFRSLESYTVDGTTSGELDYSKIWTPHTPAYSLEDEEFDGTKVLDTGVQLFDGVDNAFTIVFSITGNNETAANYGKMLDCQNNGAGFWVQNNGNKSNASKSVGLNLDGTSGGGLLNAGNYDRQLGFIRSSGLDAIAVLYTDGDVVRQEVRKTGSLSTLSETLIVGGARVNGVATAQWKGTINMLKVYKACLNPNEIIDLLGLED